MPPRPLVVAATPPPQIAIALLCLVLAALSSGATWAGEPKTPKPEPKVTHSEDKFESGKKPIKVEWFRPKAKGPRPAVLLLHESSGMHLLAQIIFHQYATMLAEEGYTVMLVHYFDRTDQKGINPRVEGEVRKGFDRWKDAVRDAVKHMAKDPGVNPRRIGMLGFSLGSFLALSVAMEKELGVAAVANLCGGLPDELWRDLKYLPPVLVMGGKKDKLVSVGKCYALRAWCEDNKIDCEFCVFEKQGHLFEDDLIQFRGDALKKSKDMQEAHRRILAFFARYLRAEKQAGPAK